MQGHGPYDKITHKERDTAISSRSRQESTHPKRPTRIGLEALAQRRSGSVRRATTPHTGEIEIGFLVSRA